jgi:sugar O-acyltransferase (sialic acid O-acetyltransferase NeuD family)
MKVIIFGTGNISELAYYYLRDDSEHEVVAFTMNKEYIQTNSFLDLPIVEFENIENIYSPSEYYLFAPVSARNLNKLREKIYIEGKNKGYKFISYISSKALCYTKDIGENCFILENNVIQYRVKIGNNCILWSGNHIGHHSTIEDNVFITSHVVISGMCVIGSYSYIGVNSCLKDNTNIAKNTVIGMCSCVNKNTEEYNIYIGVPAKKFKECDDSIIL